MELYLSKVTWRKPEILLRKNFTKDAFSRICETLQFYEASLSSGFATGRDFITRRFFNKYERLTFFTGKLDTFVQDMKKFPDIFVCLYKKSFFSVSIGQVM